MDYHSGCINDSAEPGLNLKVNLFLEKRIKVFEREEGISPLRKFFVMEDFFAQLSQSLSDGFDHDITGMDL